MDRLNPRLRVVLLVVTLLALRPLHSQAQPTIQLPTPCVSNCGPGLGTPIPATPTISTPLAAATPLGAAVAAAVPTISAPRGPSFVSDDERMKRLRRRLQNLDIEMADLASEMGAGSAYKAASVLIYLQGGQIPGGLADSSVMQRRIEKAADLYFERIKIHQDMLRIVDPGEKMYSAPTYHSANTAPSNYNVATSDTTAKGAVRCHFESKPVRRWRYVPKSAGFRRDNTPIYNYVWEPYTEETGGDVCR